LRYESTHQLVSIYANTQKLEQIPSEDRRVLENLVRDVKAKLDKADIDLAAKMSAELNGLTKFYNGQMRRDRDFFVLLCTDTWLGKSTADLVKGWLNLKGCACVEVKRQDDLQTADIELFQSALSDLVEWSESTISGYRKSGYHVVFNLTGGFKSVQGFLQTLATFYADETIYIVLANLNAFRRLALYLSVGNIRDIPETLLLRFDDEVRLSAWGDLVWKQTKPQIYGEMLHPSPSEKLIFSTSFINSVNGLSADRLEILNHRLDQLACYLEKVEKPNPRSLDFKPLRGNPCPPATHEIDAWSDQDAKRLYGHFEGDRFVLDRLGVHL
jgi:putative CRISPR-associated protein (TIGR02619 family)